MGLIGNHIPPWKVVSELKRDYCVGAVLLCPWPIVESSDIMSAECLCRPHCVTQVYRLDNLPCVYVSACLQAVQEVIITALTWNQRWHEWLTG